MRLEQLAAGVFFAERPDATVEEWGAFSAWLLGMQEPEIAPVEP